VSPKELHGLQALAAANGTSLTINPHTGLPEAFNFKKLIPMVAGAALTATGVGAPMAALMVGGAYAAGTGSIQKGLMAGIGAYGGAGLGAGLAEAGASSLVEAGGQQAAQQAASAAGTNAATTAGADAADVFAGYSPTGSAAGTAGTTVGTGTAAGANTVSAAQNAINSTAFPNYSAEGIAGLKNAAANAANPMDVVRSAGMGNVANSAQIASPTIGQSLSNMGSGIGQMTTQQGLSSVYAGMPTGTLPAIGATALDVGQKERPSVPGYQEDEYDRRLKGYKLSPDYQAYTAPTPNPYYRPTYAAEGGIMEQYDDEAGKDMAGGGITSLGGYSDGGRMLKGPGDGMSDSIPGVIGDKQPARLADGEFVVPADVVSHLGNGSTDAGAKKLYGMMDKIRQARTGKKKQAPQINVNKYLPMGKASGGITGYADGGEVKHFYNQGVVQGEVTYNSQLAANVQAAYDQGYSGSQIGAALIASGVSPETAAAATGLSSSVISQVYAGGAALNGAIGDPAGNPKVPAPPIKPVVPIVPKVPTQTYTTQQYLDFLKASMAAGNSLEVAKQDIRNKYGATDADLYAMAALYDSQNKPTTTPTTPATAGSAVYRPGFVPRTSGVNMSPAIQDPYSNQGLQSLYGQMMGQYAKAPPPMSDAEVKALAEKYAGNGAEVGRQLINAGIPVKQALSALKSYPGITPEIVNQAYIGGQTLGTAPPPTLDTQYNYSDPATYYKPPSQNNLILTTPIVDAAFKASTPPPEGLFTAPSGLVYGSKAAYDATVSTP
jgi:hypothetical protein